MKGTGLKLKRMITQRGESAVWQKLTYSEARNPAAGWKGRDYSETENIFVVVGRPSIRRVETDAGNITVVHRDFICQDAVGKGDRLVIVDGTYEVLDTPAIIQHRGETVVRRFEAARDDL